MRRPMPTDEESQSSQPSWAEQLSNANEMKVKRRQYLIVASVVAALFALCYMTYNPSEATSKPMAVSHHSLEIDVEPAAIAAQIEAEHAVVTDSDTYTRRELFLKGVELNTSDEFITRTLAAEVKEVLVVDFTPATPDPTNPTILLLHGAAFSTKNWEQIDTCQTLAKLGYHVVAVDLPGFGRSQGKVASTMRGAFLAAVVRTLGLARVVMVSPSMSGSYSLPWLLSAPSALIGFVPVTPVGVEAVTSEQWQKVSIPTMIVYGALDPKGKSRADILHQIPNSHVDVFEKGHHPCYLDDPGRFNRILAQFTSGLS